MDVYLTVKLIHIISSTLLFGTGLGTAFFMFRAYRNENPDAIRVTIENVVLADWLFTASSVVIQLVTGLWLVQYLGIPMSSAWFTWVMVLFFAVGACWIPVVWIQIRLRALSQEAPSPGILTRQFHRLMRTWVLLGIPAFTGVLILFWMMVFKPGWG